jgi:hypothetical protein
VRRGVSQRAAAAADTRQEPATVIVIAPRVPESRLAWSERRHDPPPVRRAVI